MNYEFTNIEAKWQKYWEEHKTFRAEDFSDKPKYYCLDMFPYPSGAGLHVGHPEGFGLEHDLSLDPLEGQGDAGHGSVVRLGEHRLGQYLLRGAIGDEGNQGGGGGNAFHDGLLS